ncbi:UMP kinase [Candidatus Woesearchaeota archaeon]|nr:MAG: UMP kinase [Candidatus Woesearchaeota archaeon]
MKTIVISVGGSLIVPKEINYQFIKQLKKCLLKFKDKKFVICTGGGHTARMYINALKKENINEYNLDLMGIEATRLNAYLLSSFFGQMSNKEIPTTLEEIGDAVKVNKVVVCGGLTPSQTSDGTTAMIADYLNADVLINMTNVDGLFDKDPNKYKNAKFIPKLSHKEFSKIIAKVKKKPGMHFVLDHEAAEITMKAGIKVVIMKGVKNLENFLSSKKFKGTVIS